MNGIGKLVSAWVHARHAERVAARTGAASTETSADAAVTPTGGSAAPIVDTVEFSPAALARFEAWKAKHGAADSGVTVATPEAGQTCPSPTTPELA